MDGNATIRERPYPPSTILSDQLVCGRAVACRCDRCEPQRSTSNPPSKAICSCCAVALQPIARRCFSTRCPGSLMTSQRTNAPGAQQPHPQEPRMRESAGRDRGTPRKNWGSTSYQPAIDQESTRNGWVTPRRQLVFTNPSLPTLRSRNVRSQ